MTVLPPPARQPDQIASSTGSLPVGTVQGPVLANKPLLTGGVQSTAVRRGGV